MYDHRRMHHAASMQMTDDLLDMVARRFRMLGEPQRLRILQKLQGGEKSVTQIVDEVEGNQSNISRHLQALFDAGLVSRRREGTAVMYSISDPVIFRLCDLVCESAREEARQKLTKLVTSQPEKTKRRS